MSASLLASILAVVIGGSALLLAGWCWRNRPAAQFGRMSEED